MIVLVHSSGTKRSHEPDDGVDVTSVDLSPPPAVKKRSDYLSWEEYFMSVAFLSAQRSKDPSSQVITHYNNDFRESGRTA